ncbi:MAG: phosphoserine phosphatase SerB [Alphaproteobacteria bacterium]|nr:phosphoserine phosphatase SerB [Alphaproteobacteria bacterium]MDE2336805.1 phosphoserine phosphatase SerB [Alphaproteobacteria bacterium]
MAEIAVTIVGNDLNTVLENRAAQIIKETGAGGLRIDKLHPGYAIDMLVKSDSAALADLLRKKLADLGAFDIFVQDNGPFRKKKLLIADMDATIIRQETLNELAAHLGIQDKISTITEKAMNGEIDFPEALSQRVKMLAGLPLAALAATLDKIQYSAGATTLAKTMNRHEAKCMLVSGGFEFFTAPIAEKIGFSRSFGNRLEISDGKLTGEIIPPIVDKRAKEQIVVSQARTLGIQVQQVMAIGDGANDIPMLQRAGTGVGYFAKPAVVAVIPHQIRHTDLVSALYMQGYRQSELIL